MGRRRGKNGGGVRATCGKVRVKMRKEDGGKGGGDEEDGWVLGLNEMEAKVVGWMEVKVWLLMGLSLVMVRLGLERGGKGREAGRLEGEGVQRGGGEKTIKPF